MTGKQLAEKIMNGMNVRQLERLLHIMDLVDAGQRVAAALYLRNLPVRDRAKIVGYYTALAAGDESAAI